VLALLCGLSLVVTPSLKLIPSFLGLRHYWHTLPSCSPAYHIRVPRLLENLRGTSSFSLRRKDHDARAPILLPSNVHITID
jgi:hypothetical protein